MLLAARACQNTFLFHCSFELLAGTIRVGLVQSGQEKSASAGITDASCRSVQLRMSLFNTQKEA
jgi:hypothetical protein